MVKVYNKNTKLDFGLYKGYDLGIVYVFDPFYINWCILNIDWFHISDLHELRHFGVLMNDLKLQRILGDPTMIDGINDFSSFQELISKVHLGCNLFPFKKNVILYNFEKLSLDFDNDSIETETDSSNIKADYDQYGGCNGWSEEDIDNAFDGDAEATWNVD